MILVKIPRWLRKHYTYRATTIWPFVFYKWERDKYDKFLLNHEQIHLKQQVEMLLIFFFLWYGIEYLINRIRGKSHKEAYYNLCHEKEAYYNEKDLDYFSYRPKWNFLKYIKYVPHNKRT